MSSVGKNIREYRRASGMSQQELAERVGKRRSAIGNYESGAREPDYDTLRAIARALSVSVLALLREEGDPEEDVWSLREAYRRDPDRRVLFSLARDGTSQEVRQAVALIDALKRTNPDMNGGREEE